MQRTRLSRVWYLTYNSPGTEVIKKINELFPENYFITTDLGVYRKSQPIEKGHILFEGAVSRALDELGIRNIHTAKPEEVMGVLRLNDKVDTINYFGIAILSSAVTSKSDWLNQAHINHLMQQAEVKEYELPVCLFQLRSSPDEKFPYGARLDFTEKSILLPAPDLIGGNFWTDRYHKIKDLLNSGRESRGDLEVRTENPLDGGGLRVLSRRRYLDASTSYLFEWGTRGAGCIPLVDTKMTK